MPQPHPEIAVWITLMNSVSHRDRLRKLRDMRASGILTLPRFLHRFQSVRRSPPGPSGEPPKILPDSRDRLRVVLVESLLHLRSPEEFNDPFDMGADFSIGGTEAQKVARYQGIFARNFPHGTAEQRDTFVAELMTKSPAELLPRIRTSYTNQRKCFGVVCFVGGVRPWANVLMWSHYGSEHSGVCLRFDPARDVRVFHAALHLDFNDTYPIIDFIVEFHKGIGGSLLRKHPRWKYEQEHRISVSEQAGKFLPFRPEALTGIVLGCRAAPDLEVMVRDLLAERQAKGLPNVQIYRAYQHRSRYDLRILKISTPGPVDA